MAISQGNPEAALEPLRIEGDSMITAVRIVSYTSGSARVLATVRVGKNGVEIEGQLTDGIRSMVDGAYERAKSPEQFLNDLAFEFRGAYVRAVRVRDDRSRRPQGGPLESPRKPTSRDDANAEPTEEA